MTPTEQYRENFIAAMYRVMGELQLNQSEFADWLGVGRVTVHKITQRKQFPTVEQSISLCLKAGFDANWLFLNQEEPPKFSNTRKSAQSLAGCGFQRLSKR